MDRLTSMAVFVRVAEKGSFTAAADEFELSATMVAKHIHALEAQLGARLLETTTRRQTLTEVGTAYLERCRDVLASMHAADHVAELLQAEPQGRLRVSAPITWGTHRLVPVIAQYLALYPKVRLELNLSNRVVDLAEEGIDCAIRSGRLADDRLVARELKRSIMWAVASPDYLARQGHPRHPAELASHALLSFAEWRGRHDWRFTRAGETEHVALRGSLVIDNGEALLGAALAGAGVVAQPDALLERAVDSGALIRLLPDWELPSRAMHIVRLPDARPSAKLRSFVDFVIARLG